MFFDDCMYEQIEPPEPWELFRDTLLFGTCFVASLITVGIVSIATMFIMFTPLGISIFADLYLDQLN